MVIYWTKTTEGRSNSLSEVPKGATINSIDGDSCIGKCEGCLKPILEGEKYGADEEGNLVCLNCINGINEE